MGRRGGGSRTGGRGGEGGVSVEESERLGGWGIETDFPLAHLEPDGGKRERCVVTVVDRDFDCRCALHVGAEGCGDAELFLSNLMACLGEVNTEDGAGEGFAERVGWGGCSRGVVGDADIAAEVGLEVRGESEGDAFDGNAFRKIEGGYALATALGDRSSFGCRGVERLGLATGGDGDRLHHLWERLGPGV